MYRVEDKYCCSIQEMYYLQRVLGAVLQSDSNESSVEGYSISSLYFDDWEDSCLRDTVDGTEIRCKYRIRIYNHSLDTIKLEVKEKLDSRIYKKSRNITQGQMRQLMCGECIENIGSMEDPATLFNLAIRTRGLRPRVIVTYERKAFIYQAGNVRITFDRNVRADRFVENFGKPDSEYDWLRVQDAVLEVKYDEFIPSFILQLLEIGNMQQTTYSKYQLCRERYREI